MQLREYTKKIDIRRVGRSIYALIPSEVAKELQIREGETATVLLDYEQRIVAYKFVKSNEPG